ncbi:TetR family transcriptional regulator [Nocardia mangyaensis]|uniref:TetR family transcriptional regulator n=1 Tax=Nocardia mangyaensis TaxID=2213200 RepID=A0A1J0VSM5_9NOCA|nr:helix-turn-helix domain-containing protein [Nocardia mangyaensis]APE35038.1 TetR family transcriptional regulator [Nocardia mangyaensis]
MTGQADWLAGGDRRALAIDRIERAALALFLDRGIDSVKTEDIAAAAGCSRATLYRYVGGKPRIVRAVMVRAAGNVVARVEAAIDPVPPSRRPVEAILAAVAALRADPVLRQWLIRHRSADTDDFLANAPELGRIATTLTSIAPDDAAASWIVRVVLSLLTWPLPDATAERRLVERFVGPVLRSR